MLPEPICDRPVRQVAPARGREFGPAASEMPAGDGDDEPSKSKKMPGYCRTVALGSVSMRSAIDAACRPFGDGVIIWKLVGADGFTMERREIENPRRRDLKSTPGAV
jgi:hypothetical protein